MCIAYYMYCLHDLNSSNELDKKCCQYACSKVGEVDVAGLSLSIWLNYSIDQLSSYNSIDRPYRVLKY